MDEFDFKTHIKRMWLTVNRSCNFRCPWCYGQSKDFNVNSNMSLDLAKKLVGIGKEAGAKDIILIGGEPTIWPHFFEFIRFCKDSGLRVVLATNGYMFSKPDFWNEYIKNPCDNVGISIKSGTKSDFEKVTGRDLFVETLAGASRVIQFHKCGFATVHNSLQGIDGTFQIGKMMKAVGAGGMNIGLCSAFLTESGSKNDTYTTAIHQLVSEIIQLKEQLEPLYGKNLHFELFLPLCLFPVDFVIGGLSSGQFSTHCNVHNRSGLVFDTNGDVLTCNVLLDTKIAEYGKDFTDGKTLLEHLNSPEMIENYKKLLKYPSEECSDCSFKALCRGGCLTHRFNMDSAICKAVHLPEFNKEDNKNERAGKA